MFALMFLVFGGIDSYAGYPLHHTEEAWTVGDTAHARKRDLAEHILAATVDYDGKLLQLAGFALPADDEPLAQSAPWARGSRCCATS